MKKLLGIVVLGLLLNSNVYSDEPRVWYKDENTIHIAHKTHLWDWFTDIRRVATEHCRSHDKYMFWIQTTSGKAPINKHYKSKIKETYKGSWVTEFFCSKEQLTFAPNNSFVPGALIFESNYKAFALKSDKKKKIAEKPKKQEPVTKKKVTLEVIGKPYPGGDALFKTQKTKLVKKDTWDLYSFFHSTIQEVKNRCTLWKNVHETRKNTKCFITVIRYSDSTNPNKVQKIVNRSGIVTHKVKIGWNGIEGAIADATPIKPKKKKPKKQTPDDDKILPASSGSGFFVTRAGHLVTNYHVIEECDAVKISFKGQEIQADTIAIDQFNDLAIIKTKINPTKVFPVSNKDVSLLQDIIVAGFPLGKKISAAIKTHKGSVSAIAGIGDNYSNFQTDATINHGNSGGPILTQKGNVIGVAVQLIPPDKAQNIFFGVKSSTLTTFAKANNINFLPPNHREMSNEDLGQLITEATVFLECWLTVAKIKRLIAQEENRKAFYSKFK